MIFYNNGDLVTVGKGKKVWTVVRDLGGSVAIKAKLSPGYSNSTIRVKLKGDLHLVEE